MRYTKSGFSVAWEQYSSVMCAGFQELQQRAEFVDMTIAADGHLVRAHQMVVGLASPFLREMLRSAPSPHPVLFLNNVSHEVLCCLLEYMYTGEAFVRGENLKDFIATGKALHVRGLEDTMLPSNPPTEETSEVPTSPPSTKESDCQIISMMSDTLNPRTVVKEHDKGIVRSPQLSATQPLSKTVFTISSLRPRDMPDVASLPANIQNIDIEMDTPEATALSEDDQQQDDDNEMYSNYELEHKATETVESDPADKETERKKIKIMYTVSNKGGLQLILNRYMYRLNRKYKDGRRRWECVDYKKKCKAGVVTEDDNVLRRFSMHNHPFHDRKVLEKVKKNAVFTSLANSGFN